MFFASDNTAGVSEPIMAALIEANRGKVSSYGGDETTAAVTERLSEVFEREVEVFLVVTGTAANSLALSALTPPWGAILCHEASHAMTDECGAPEFYSGGAKMIGLPGPGAKIDPQTLDDLLKGWGLGVQHHVQPAAVTISQASEYGLVWRPEEVIDIAEVARRHGLKLHMDGARFANAVAAGNVSPADLTWRAGVDALSFGATKGGAMCAEAVVVFSEDAASLLYRRKRAGHLISKSRFVAAQLLAYLKDGHWLDLARHANSMARDLSSAVERSGGGRLAAPVEANEAFIWLQRETHERLQAAGAKYYEWSGPGPGIVEGRDGEILGRFVTSFATTREEVERFTGLLARRPSE